MVAIEGGDGVAAAARRFRAADGRPLAEHAENRIVFGHWTDGEHGEEVVLVRGAADALEVHCHGGAAAAARIVEALAAAGCAIVPWAEHVRRTSRSLIEQEAAVALAEAATRRTAAILLDQYHGALEAAVDAALVELRHGRVAAARERVAALADAAGTGSHLTRPWHVAIAGRPNVGKSSLLNALVGYERAIVYDQPGTTRDVLSADTAIDGWPVRLTDAAGLRATSEPIEAEGVARARRQAECADLVLWVLDATCAASVRDPLATAEREMSAERAAAGGGDAERQAPLVVLNKIDLVDQAVGGDESFVAASALRGTGLEAVLAAISRRLAPNPPAAGQGVPFTARQALLVQTALAALEAGDAAGAGRALEAVGRKAEG